MKHVSEHILSRVYILFGFFLLVGVAIVFRILTIQWDTAHWDQKKIDEQIFFKKSVADRGNILASDGTILATSLPFYTLAMDPGIIDTGSWAGFSDSLYQLSYNFATYFTPEQERDSLDSLRVFNIVRKGVATGDRHVFLSRKKFNFKELETIKTWPILRRGKYEGGLIVNKFSNERYYPMEDLARITLGRIIQDTVPIRGLEFSFNKDLRGEDGFLLAQKVVGKSYVPLNQYGEDPSIDGYDIVTTLDVDLQEITERALQKGVESNYAKHGVAILMEVNTGKVKAIANYPETFNYAVASRIEPGSTFKIASAAALLDDQYLTIDDTIATGDGTVLYDDKEITDNGKAYGDISFLQVIAKSSNVGMATMIDSFYKREPERFIQHIWNFGFESPHFDQISGEPTPKILMPEDEEWTIATLPSLSYGYSLSVTPLQMATFYNGLANNGMLMRPWIVKEVRNNAQIVRTYNAETLNPKMVKTETIKDLKKMMRAVVTKGTAKNAFKKMPIEVAGKTGTVRKIENGRYVRKYRASFGGFFPVDTPRYSLYIMIDDPDGGTASGGRVAAPVFREIAEEIYKMDVQLTKPPKPSDEGINLLPPTPGVFTQNVKTVFDSLKIATNEVPGKENWLRTEGEGQKVSLTPLENEVGRVPDLKGMSARDALLLMEQMGVEVDVRGVGKVRRQSLLPGYRIGEDTRIIIFCS
ncbi:MAG: penicillin-binding protein [Bacteroidota bacterium]